VDNISINYSHNITNPSLQPAKYSLNSLDKAMLIILQKGIVNCCHGNFCGQKTFL